MSGSRALSSRTGCGTEPKFGAPLRRMADRRNLTSVPDRPRRHQITRLMRATCTVTAAVLLLIAAGAACTKERSRPFRIRSLVPEGREAFEASLFQTTGARLTPGHSLELVNDGRIF